LRFSRDYARLVVSPPSSSLTLLSSLSSHDASTCTKTLAQNGREVLYAIGGINEDGMSLPVMERYDHRREEWFECAPMITSRYSFDGVAYRDRYVTYICLANVYLLVITMRCCSIVSTYLVE
jgi:hypothetical protein